MCSSPAGTYLVKAMGGICVKVSWQAPRDNEPSKLQQLHGVPQEHEQCRQVDTPEREYTLRQHNKALIVPGIQRHHIPA